MKLFTLYWNDGTKSTAKATSLCEAIGLLGVDYKKATRKLKDYTAE